MDFTESTPRPPSLLAQPGYLASQVAKHGRRHLEEVLAAHDMRLIDLAVLCALDDFGSRSQQQLADALDFDKSHLVRRLDRLEERALVTRIRDPSDRRRNALELTSAGKELVDRLQQASEASQRGFLDSLSAAERRTLISLLRRVLAANDAARMQSGERSAAAALGPR